MNRRGRVMSTNVSRNKLVQALFRTFISVWLYKEISTSWRPIISTNTYLSLIIFKYVRTAKGPVRKGYNPLIHILATNKKGYNPLIPTNYCCLFFNDWKSLLSTVQSLCMLCLLINYYQHPLWVSLPLTPVLIIVCQKREWCLWNEFLKK